MFSQKGWSTPRNVTEEVQDGENNCSKNIVVFVAGQLGFDCHSVMSGLSHVTDCKVEKPTENGKLFYEHRIRWRGKNSWQEISTPCLSFCASHVYVTFLNENAINICKLIQDTEIHNSFYIIIHLRY